MNPSKFKILLEGNEVKKILQRRINLIFGSRGKILKVKIRPIKIYRDSRSFGLIAIYRVWMTDLQGGTHQKTILASAHSSGSKNRDFQITKLIFKYLSKSSTKIYQLPKPYTYIKPHSLFLREFIKGKVLSQEINRYKELKVVSVRRLVACLLEFQKIKIPESRLILKKKWVNLYDLEKNIEILKNRQHPRFQFLKNEFQKIKTKLREIAKYESEQKKVFSHGDLNPLNIILTDNNKVALLDLGSVGWRNHLWDVASFYSHLGTLPDLKIRKSFRTKAQQLFLNTYLKMTREVLTPKKKLLFIFYKKYFDILALTHNLVWGN